MPSGHTQRDTINRRRPLTPGMRKLLAEMADGGTYATCDTARKNQMRALMDRGLATAPDRPGGLWRITDEGRAALEVK